MSGPPDDDDLIPFSPGPDEAVPSDDVLPPVSDETEDRDAEPPQAPDAAPSDGGVRLEGGAADGGMRSDAAPSDGGVRPDGSAAGGGMCPDSAPSGGGVSDGGGFGTDPGESLGGGDLASAAGAHPSAAGGSAAGAGWRAKRTALRKAVLLGAVVAASIVALGVGAYGLLKPYLAPDDFKGTGSGTVTVRIAPGANAGDIGAALAEAGVVASARSFVNATRDRAVAGRLRPGHYRLRKGMAAGAALDLLLAPASRVIRRVTVPEGMRVGETLVRVARQSGLALKELQAVDTALVGLPKYARGLEGFLFPATYEVEPGDKAVDLLAAMVERFGAAARKLRLVDKAARVHMNPLEAVTVASMVQAEGGRDEDYPKIARVIYNRLQRGTPLQIDSTVLYAQGKRSPRVTERDTKVRSPYNTYAHTGLPPGPIANPGEKALIAALHPADGDWHWFVTTDPAHRITKFTNKESEFVRYREELNRNLGTK